MLEMRRKIVLWGAIIFNGLLVSSQTVAFPELTQHGYFHCSTCHFSPSGGGILTDYGRALSKEVLSHGSWFFEASKAQAESAPSGADLEPEVQFSYGLVATPKWLKLGGDIRTLQAFRDSQRETTGRFIVMQADLEMVFAPEIAGSERIRADFTFGRDEPRVSNPQLKDYLISRRHWVSLLLGPTDQLEKLQLRAGRFFPAYGIQFPEHTFVTRRKLGFDQSHETYNVEGNLQLEEWAVTLTGILGRPDISANGGRGASLQVARALSNARIGINGMWTYDAQTDFARRSWGLFGNVPIFGPFYMAVDWNWTSRVFSGARVSDTGWVDIVKLGVEPSQGIHFFLTQELYHPTYFRESAVGLLQGKTEAYGFGIQYFPRPHWDLSLHLRKERVSTTSLSFDSVAWMNLHYYL